MTVQEAALLREADRTGKGKNSRQEFLREDVAQVFISGYNRRAKGSQQCL
jgi:hypothetical protein